MAGFIEATWLWILAVGVIIAESVLWLGLGLWLLYRVQPTRRLLKRAEKAVELYLRGNRGHGTG